MLEAGFGEDKIEFCPPPMDIDNILSLADAPLDHKWLTQNKQSQDIPVILSAGRWDVQKNFPLLLKAFAKARKSRELRLIILGSGDADKLQTYRKLADELSISKHVDFLGFVRNPYAYMKVADVFALSSDWEGFGLVLAEALICARALSVRIVLMDLPKFSKAQIIVCLSQSETRMP